MQDFDKDYDTWTSSEIYAMVDANINLHLFISLTQNAPSFLFCILLVHFVFFFCCYFFHVHF
jgi:hypothetical protein